MASVHVIAIITTKPGKRADVLKHFHANMPAVHAEDGCVYYFPTTDAKKLGDFHTEFGPDTFVVLEEWASPEALVAHTKAPHMATYAGKVKDMLANRVIHVVEKA